MGKSNVLSERGLCKVVSTKAERIKVAKWMEMEIERSGTSEEISIIAVMEFSMIFRAVHYKANVQKASRIFSKMN